MSFAIVIPEEMRKKYLERRRRDLDVLEQSMAQGKFEEFSRIGHQLKGNAPTFGYDELGEIGRRMEEAGESANTSLVESSFQEFQSWVRLHSLG